MDGSAQQLLNAHGESVDIKMRLSDRTPGRVFWDLTIAGRPVETYLSRGEAKRAADQAQRYPTADVYVAASISEAITNACFDLAQTEHAFIDVSEEELDWKALGEALGEVGMIDWSAQECRCCGGHLSVAERARGHLCDDCGGAR